MVELSAINIMINISFDVVDPSPTFRDAEGGIILTLHRIFSANVPRGEI